MINFFDTINDPEFKSNYKQVESFFRKGRDMYLTSQTAEANQRKVTDIEQQTTTPMAKEGWAKYATPFNLTALMAGAIMIYFIKKG